jgi:hypothetical protein
MAREDMAALYDRDFFEGTTRTAELDGAAPWKRPIWSTSPKS